MSIDPDWAAMLARKYDILGQNANAEMTKANAAATEAGANANFTNVRAGLLPGQSAADVAEAKARTNQINVNAGIAPGMAAATEANLYGEAARSRAEVPLLGEQTTSAAKQNQFISSVGNNNPLLSALAQRLFGGLGLGSLTVSDPNMSSSRLGLGLTPITSQ